MSTDIDHYDRWPGHARLARRLILGMTPAGPELRLMFWLVALCLMVSAALLNPTDLTVVLLTMLLAGFVAAMSARATAQAYAAMGALWLAPQAARRQWLRGWWQLQSRAAPTLALVGFGVVAWRVDPSGQAWLLPGVVLFAQVVGACSAVARTTAQHLLVVAATLLLIGVNVLPTHRMPQHIAALAPWVSSVLVVASALYLWRLHGRLLALAAGQGQRPRVTPPPSGVQPRVRAWLEKWVTMELDEAHTQAQLWAGVAMPMLMLIAMKDWRSGSVWQASQGSNKLLLMGWLVLGISSSLVHRPIHWRQWLRPGGIKRHLLGWHILSSTLKLHGMTCVALVALAGGIACAFGTPTEQITHTVLSTWPLLLEWCVAATLAVAWAGLCSTRRSGAWAAALFIAVPSGICLYFTLRDGPYADWGTVNASYVGTLAFALVVMLPVVQAVWARVDVHRLMTEASTRRKQQGQA